MEITCQQILCVIYFSETTNRHQGIKKKKMQKKLNQMNCTGYSDVAAVASVIKN